MVDLARQVPPSPATAWAFDLSPHRGPLILALRQPEGDARRCVAAHLIEIGAAHDERDAAELLAEAPVRRADVIW